MVYLFPGLCTNPTQCIHPHRNPHRNLDPNLNPHHDPWRCNYVRCQ